MSARTGRFVTAFVAAFVVGSAALALSVGVQVAASAPAYACANYDTSCGTSQQDGDSGVPRSSGTTTATYTSLPGQGGNCLVYGNGAGMGSFCIPTGGGKALSLRERFGGQTLQKCRYSPLPDGIPVPFNANPDVGRYLLMTCMQNIDLDSTGGGFGRSLSINPVFVPWGTDIKDKHNGITDFLWQQLVTRANQLPVPFMLTRPNPIPVVGVPSFFTFRWIDPATGQVRAMGPYDDRPGGGPFLELESDGLTMRAQATKIRINPMQRGIGRVECDPATPYREGRPASEQPADACSIVFPRSSASARANALEPIPADIDDAFYVSVQVDWRITYGQPGDMRELGDGFTMRLRQVVPVQEVQAPNQPPTVIY